MTERKNELLGIAVKLAAKFGVVNVTREMIAKEAGISAVAVGKHLGTTEARQKAIRKAFKASGKTEPNKKAIAEHGVQLRAKGPRKVKPAAPAKKKPAVAPQRKPDKPTRAPRPKPSVVHDAPPSAD